MNINELAGKKFIASYSGGKDSVLALYRAMNAGLVPFELLTTYNIDENRSWFHGASNHILQKVSESVSIPIKLLETSGEKYEENFERYLWDAKSEGAEVCVFGDIDIEGHLEWCTKRCENVGLVPCFPLWGEERKKLVYEFVDSGFSTLITIVDTNRMPQHFLGCVLSREVADAIEESGADICGENGEYHTFVYDGPIFSKRIEYAVKDVIKKNKYVMLPLE